MAAQLSEELQQALAREGDRPLQVVDPSTQKVYVLISADVFDRLKVLLNEPLDVRDTYAAQDAALQGVWSDPELDEYADYDRHRRQQP